MNKKNWLKDASGMTLIEIMVVVTILGMIAAAVTVSVTRQMKKAQVSTAKTQMKSLEEALEHYRLEAGSYPSTEQSLNALVTPPAGKAGENFPEEGFIKKVPKDPWGEEFRYTSPGANGHPYEIVSPGPDRQEGTSDDIKNWELE